MVKDICVEFGLYFVMVNFFDIFGKDVIGVVDENVDVFCFGNDEVDSFRKGFVRSCYIELFGDGICWCEIWDFVGVMSSGDDGIFFSKCGFGDGLV